MEQIISLAGGIAIIVVFVWFVSRVLSIWSDAFSAIGPRETPLSDARESAPDANGDHPDGVNDGDFHSGPGGYEPGTAYPDTHYGEYGRDE